MSTALPIVCSLSAGDLAARLAQIVALGRDALLEVRHEATHAQLRFAAHDGVRARVDGIVAAESECCAFLTMRVSDLADTVVLSIDAPQGADLVLAELVGAFRGQPRAA